MLKWRFVISNNEIISRESLDSNCPERKTRFFLFNSHFTCCPKSCIGVLVGPGVVVAPEGLLGLLALRKYLQNLL